MDFNPEEMKNKLYEFETKKDISINELEKIENFLDRHEYLKHFNSSINKFGYKDIYDFRRAYVNGEPASKGYCQGFVFSFINRAINTFNNLNN